MGASKGLREFKDVPEGLSGVSGGLRCKGLQGLPGGLRDLSRGSQWGFKRSQGRFRRLQRGFRGVSGSF